MTVRWLMDDAGTQSLQVTHEAVVRLIRLLHLRLLTGHDTFCRAYQRGLATFVSCSWGRNERYGQDVGGENNYYKGSAQRYGRDSIAYLWP